MRTVIGIDVSHASSQVAVVVDQQVREAFKIENNLIGFNRLLLAIQQFEDVPEIVFEATGEYSRRLAYFLSQRGYRYLQYNPLAAKREMDSLRPVKTDKTDAARLAQTQYLLQHEMTLLTSPVYIELRDISRAYQQANSEVVSNKNRLHKELQLTFPEIETLLSTTDSKLYWHLVIQFPHAQYVLGHDLQTLTDTVLGSTGKNMGTRRAEKIAEKLINLASKSAVAVTQTAFATSHVQFLAQQVEYFSARKNELISRMADIAQQLPEYEILLSIPGIAMKTACILIAELGDVRRFSTTNKLNAFVGIDLWISESGDYKGQRHIRKRGNSIARKTLFRTIINMASAANETHQCHINDWYQAKKQQLPDSTQGKKKITVGAMHRLLRTIHYLVNNNQMYDYAKATKL